MDAGDTTQEFSICDIHISVSQRETSFFFFKLKIYPIEKFTFLTEIHSYSQYQIKVYECGMPHLY